MRIGFISNAEEEEFVWAHENGIPCVEFNTAGTPESVDSLLAKKDAIIQWKKKYGVDISHVGVYGWDRISENAEVRQQADRTLRKVIDFVADIKAPLITTGGGELSGRGLWECSNLLSDVIAPAVHYAEEKGLKFAFYNCHWTNFVIGPEAWSILLSRLPSVGIKFDPSHPRYDGKDWEAQLAEWGHRVYHTHAKDTLFINGKPFEDVPAGLGNTHWGHFMALLHHHHYTGDINIEPHSRTWHGARMFEGILIAKRHLEQLL